MLVLLTVIHGHSNELQMVPEVGTSNFCYFSFMSGTKGASIASFGGWREDQIGQLILLSSL